MGDTGPRLISGKVALAEFVALALCVGFGLAFAIANVRSWELEDAQAYWNAALRIRDGGQLYIAVQPNADETVAYRYAPWFAWLWVPLTWLPKPIVEAGWSFVLIAACAIALLPLIRTSSVASVCLAALMGGLLVRTASTGNVHALMIALLVWGIRRPSGPIWIGIAASLKVLPILLIVPYLGQRRFRQATLALSVAVALWVPALAYDLSTYPSEAGDSLSLLSNVGLAAFIFGGLVVSAVSALAVGTRYAWLAASVSVIAWLPRLELYSLTYLILGTTEDDLSRSRLVARSTPHVDDAQRR